MSESPMAASVVTGGPDDGDVIVLPIGTTTIGRDSANAIVVDEPSVSRMHSCIKGDFDGHYILDLDSSNGTFVNGAEVGTQPHRLRNMDRIEVGGTDSVHWIFMESRETIVVPQWSTK